MSIGKSSITKRVAKSTEAEEKAPVTVEKKATATPKAEPTASKQATAKKTSTPAKKPAATTTKSTASKPSTAKKKTSTAAKKPANKKEAPKSPATTNNTVVKSSAVFANISPETVAAVTGKKENDGFKKFSLGDDLPVHLL